jgi:hypothetical protein
VVLNICGTVGRLFFFHRTRARCNWRHSSAPGRFPALGQHCFTPTIFSSVETKTFRIIIWHLLLFSIMYNTPSLTNSTLYLLMCFWYVPKNLYVNCDSHSPFHRKYIFACWLGAPPSRLTSCTPTKSNLYFEISCATVLSEPALYILLTFQVPNLISIFFRLGRLSKDCFQVWGFLWTFVTSLFLYGEELLVPRPTPLRGLPSFVGRSWLIIQYIRRYSTYLGPVSSIRNLRTGHAVLVKDPNNMGIHSQNV